MRVAQLLPLHCNEDYTTDCAAAAFTMYRDKLDSMSECMSEFERWHHTWSLAGAGATGIGTFVSDVLSHCDNNLFPNLNIVFHIFATIPVTYCTA